jgi:predicted XRE-type DNA-binding protein
MTDKPIEWIGAAKAELMDFPADARRRTGFELRSIQQGDPPSDFKPMSIVELMISSSTQNIFEELGFPPEESENLRIRSDLMISLRQLIRSRQWTSEQAAQHFKTTVDRVEELLAGEIDRFQMEQLITMLSYAGMQVRVEVTAAA